MGDIKTTLLVTPLVAFLYRIESTFEAALDVLQGSFGPVQLCSAPFPFTQTEYYQKSMGGELTRRFVVFEKLADPAKLPFWKCHANDLEVQFSEKLNPERVDRPINIDPGYLTGSKLVLASTKDFAHRIYLGQGIFAEITLNYIKGAWTYHRCTFPDFRKPTYHDFLSTARSQHLLKGPRRAQ